MNKNTQKQFLSYFTIKVELNNKNTQRKLNFF